MLCGLGTGDTDTLKEVVKCYLFFLSCGAINPISHRFYGMGIIIGIIVTIIGLGLVYRDKGRWYEYVVAIIIGCFVCLGFHLIC